jgi:hypothetical protein
VRDGWQVCRGADSPEGGSAGQTRLVVRTAAHPVGRADLIAAARAHLAAGRSVVVQGPAGIGKSTLLDELATGPERGPERGVVLRSAAAEAEAELPYLALVDLFDGSPPEAFAALPAHLRAALDGALLRGALPSTPYDQLAVRLAVLELLRALAAERQVLLVLDDVQWIDEPSAGVLSFVARRLEGTAVRVLAAERVADGAVARGQELCPQPTVELPVGPLSEVDVADLLRGRFGGAMSRRDVSRVFRAGGGNPLYTVELGRAIGERASPVPPMEPLPVPGRLRGLLAARIATLPEAEHPALLLTAAAARPSHGLLRRCGVTIDPRLAAVRTGVIAVDTDGAVRFSHPLLREMVYADASADDRRTAHEQLAGVVSIRSTGRGTWPPPWPSRTRPWRRRSRRQPRRPGCGAPPRPPRTSPSWPRSVPPPATRPRRPAAGSTRHGTRSAPGRSETPAATPPRHCAPPPTAGPGSGPGCCWWSWPARTTPAPGRCSTPRSGSRPASPT